MRNISMELNQNPKIMEKMESCGTGDQCSLK